MAESSSPKAAKADTVQSRKIDPADEWREWRDLSQAVALRALDGPEDILEKNEIIEDRVDALLREQKKLQAELRAWLARHRSVETQIEVLDDLADLQRGGDLQLQQRVHRLREDSKQTGARIYQYQTSLEDLMQALAGLEKMTREYRIMAADMRRREEGVAADTKKPRKEGGR